MIKTLHITGLVAAILAGILLVFPVIFGVRSEERVEQLLKSPDVIEKFKEIKAGKTAGYEDSTGGGPIVEQAQAFALYLQPPQPKVDTADKQGAMPAPRGPVAVKFALVGTSFFAAHPELSLAFIDEPGKGFRWIRQSNQIGYLVIEQIKDGSIIVRDGQKTYEMLVQKGPDLDQPVFALTSGLATSSVASLNQPEQSTIGKGSLLSPPPKMASKPTFQPISKANTANITESASSEPQLTDEQNVALEKFIERLKSLQKDEKSDKIDINEAGSSKSDISNLSKSIKESVRKDKQLEEIASDYQSERVSQEEADKLNGLGEELQEGKKE